MTARPHHLGSAYGKQNAEFMASLFQSWGYETTIERFDVLFPTPKTRVVELLAPERYTAKLAEPALKEDATSGQTDEILPPFNAYSVDGDVTGELVYVNYGVPEDYEVLERTVSTCTARSSSRAMAARGAASNRRSPRSTAPSAASSTPIRATTATSKATSIRWARIAASTVRSAGPWRTCRCTPAIR